MWFGAALGECDRVSDSLWEYRKLGNDKLSLIPRNGNPPFLPSVKLVSILKFCRFPIDSGTNPTSSNLRKIVPNPSPSEGIVRRDASS